MSKKPESVLKRLLPDKITSPIILDRPVNLIEEVSLPYDISIEDLLHEHPERVLLWERYLKDCDRVYQKLQDELEEEIGRRRTQYWQQLETAERAEMSEHLHDEDEVDKDKFRGTKARDKRASFRTQSGVDAGRWRRNFTDDLINGYVHSDFKVVTLKTEVRKAKARRQVAYAVVEALKTRTMCLNHLAAIHRDVTKT